ncbi:unnamed protein product [Adineta ricciae]|uniref:Uncharacterized protein n=1 Tax=Adineta ricciae TaxID=249248 RepID=A0A815TI26_ADIRI|nr:unnamed protein product [Adineta ricciae]CAF1506764.1 unnamed protein product [Adineta ricciae]
MSKKYDRIFGGLFSPVSLAERTSLNQYRHDAKSIIQTNDKHLTNQDVHFDVHSPQSSFMSISGSNNHGLAVNKAEINVTNVFDRPLILHSNQYFPLGYCILVILIYVIFIIVLVFIHCIWRKRTEKRCVDNKHGHGKKNSEPAAHKKIIERKKPLYSTLLLLMTAYLAQPLSNHRHDDKKNRPITSLQKEKELKANEVYYEASDNLQTIQSSINNSECNVERTTARYPDLTSTPVDDALTDSIIHRIYCTLLQYFK